MQLSKEQAHEIAVQAVNETAKELGVKDKALKIAAVQTVTDWLCKAEVEGTEWVLIIPATASQPCPTQETKTS
jgi:hypothetical protein